MNRRRPDRWAIRALCALAVASAAVGLAGEARAEGAASAGDLLKSARAAYEKRTKTPEAKRAVELYEKAIAANPSYEALWEGARAAYFLGEYPMGKASRDTRLALFNKGVEWAKAAIAKRPDAADGHFWHAVDLACWGQTRGILKSLSVAPDVRRSAEKAKSIDPDVECAGPYRVLGRYYLKLPGVAGGDRQKSLSILEEGVKRCPTNDLGRYYLADTLRAVGQRDRAKQECLRILNTQPDPRFQPEYQYVADMTRELLGDLQ